MKLRRNFIFVLALAAISAIWMVSQRPSSIVQAADDSASAVAGDKTNVKPATPAKLLFVTQSLGFKHGVVDRAKQNPSLAEKKIKEWGDETHLYTTDFTQDVAKDFTKENLQKYDLVMFYTTGDRDKWKEQNVGDETLEYFLNDWLKQKGHGFIGIHSATDTLKDYKPYWDMIGGTFNDHPWTSNSKVTVTVQDPEHPITKPWGNEFTITDEIYQYKNWQPEKVHVLMSLDIGRSVFTPDIKKRIREPYHVPIAWCKEYGEGKVFNMSLGHNESTWNDPRFRDSILGGIEWELGLKPG
ncbi:MAG TPA: ThuA domain-containing protein, partial [Pirellulales bacterium]